MSERDLERLFQDFRERGDVSALAEVFDRTSDELLTVALHLVTEPAQAEDVVQATFLTAIQRAESFDATREVRPWLVGILANQAARVRSERARGIDPTRLESRVQPDPSEELERAEVAQVLARAVEDLPEPYRAAVKRHVLDGERAVDIARQSGVAAGTVRMHILRGLERLRRALPATMLGAGAWPVRGNDSVRSTVLEAARTKARVLAASTTASTATGISAPLWTIGGLLVLAKIMLGVLALLVGAFFLWHFAQGHETPASSVELVASTTPASVPAPPDSPPASDLARRSAATEQPKAPPNPPSSAGWWLAGSVTGLDGQPAKDTLITVRRTLADEVIQASCDASGHFSVDVTTFFASASPPELLVDAEHPANRDGSAIVQVSAEDVERGRSARVDIPVEVRLIPFACVIGSVSLPDRSSGPFLVRLYPSSAKPDVAPGLEPVGGDKKGGFKFHVKAPGEVTVRAAGDGCLPAERTTTARAGETTDVGVIELSRGDVTIEGDVRLPFDRGNIRLRVHALRSDVTWDERDGWFDPDRQLLGRSQFALVDAAGHFRMTGLSTGEWNLGLNSATDGVCVAWQETVPCRAPTSGVILGKRLGRVVVDVESDGHPCPAVRVIAHRPESMDQATTGADGHATFLSDLDHDLDLDARFGEVKSPRTVLLASERGPDMVQVILLPAIPTGRATLALQPVGAKPESAVLLLHVPGSFQEKSSHAKLLEGRYTFANVPAGKWKAEAAPPSVVLYGAGGGEFLCNDRFDLDLADGQVLMLPVNFVEGGRVHVEVEGWTKTTEDHGNGFWAHVRVLDETEQDVEAVFAVRKYEKGMMTTSTMRGSIPLDNESEMAQALRPGVYRLVLDSKVWETPPISFRVVANEMVTVRVPLTKR
jgi:RNA polymerase sigma-70 factor (ECF subfamily)